MLSSTVYKFYNRCPLRVTVKGINVGLTAEQLLFRWEEYSRKGQICIDSILVQQ